MKPFSGFAPQLPTQWTAYSGLTLMGWWSFGPNWQAGATINNGSGEDRLSQFDPAFGPAASLTQTTDSKRPRYYDETWKGQLVPHTEYGRGSYMECWDAGVAGMADAELCSYVAMGVNDFGAWRSPCWWWSATGFEDPMTVIGGNLVARRYESVGGYSTKTITTVASTAGECAWCVIRRGVVGGGVQETWSNGQYLGSVTHSLVGDITGSAMLTGTGSATNEARTGELILFRGNIALAGGGDAYARFAAVSKIYNGMRARWGV